MNLIASVGIAPNKFLANIASDLKKPDRFVMVDPGRIQEFLRSFTRGEAVGVGRVTAQALEQLGIRTIGDVRRLSQDVLRQRFGGHGGHLWDLAHGRDDRRVVPDREAKSISHETTFVRDIEDTEVLRAWVMELGEQVACRLRRHELCGRTVHLKVRYGDFHTITRSSTLPSPTNVTREICDLAAEMLRQRLPKRRLSVRLLGVGVSGLDRALPLQRLLFDVDEHAVQANLDKATDPDSRPVRLRGARPGQRAVAQGAAQANASPAGRRQVASVASPLDGASQPAAAADAMVMFMCPPTPGAATTEETIRGEALIIGGVI